MRSVVVMVLVSAGGALLPPTALVDEMSQRIAHKMFECAREMYPGVGFVREILDFWNVEYDFTMNEPLGCLQACSLLKLGLRNADGALNETNIEQFLLTLGGDDKTVTAIKEVLLRCHNASKSVKKTCTASIEAMKCFRSHMYSFKWVPQFQYGPYDELWTNQQTNK